MPELPEVETMRRGVAPIQGGWIVHVEVFRTKLRPITIQPRLSALRQRVCQQPITAVARVGKRVAWRFQDGGHLVFEPRMTGLLLVADPPNEEHLRVHFRLRGCPISDVWFWDRRGLGSMYYLREAAFRARFSARLGPDALAVSLSQLRRQFGSCDREIKVALLDQARLAGVGNLYASEILHRAGIHPQVRCTDLSDAAWRRLHRALRSVLLAAIRYEGSTLADGTYRNALNRDGSYQNCHRVYQKTGQPCARCHRGTIQRTVQAQRATFFCPVCQYK